MFSILIPEENKPSSLAAMFLTNRDGLNNPGRRLPKEHSCPVILKIKVREKSRECHNNKPQPFQDTKIGPVVSNCAPLVADLFLCFVMREIS